MFFSFLRSRYLQSAIISNGFPGLYTLRNFLVMCFLKNTWMFALFPHKKSCQMVILPLIINLEKVSIWIVFTPNFTFLIVFYSFSDLPMQHHSSPFSPQPHPLVSLQQFCDLTNLKVKILNARGDIRDWGLWEMVDTGYYLKPILSKFLDVLFNYFPILQLFTEWCKVYCHGIFFIVIQLQLYAFSPHPSTPQQYIIKIILFYYYC